MKKRLLSVLLSLVLVMGLLPTAVFADNTAYTTLLLDKGTLFIQGLGSRIRVDQTNPDGETETKYYDIGQPIVVTMSSDVTETSNTLAINGFQSSLTVILDGVNIKTSDRAAVSVSSTCDVTIKLSGINRLTGAYNYAGLQKNESTNGKLYIEDATGSGELIATGGVGAAGIGTNYSTQELQKTKATPHNAKVAQM